MNLKQFVESQEGREHKAYVDAGGHSIGVGHFLTQTELITGFIHLRSGSVRWAEGLTDSQIDELLEQDLAKVVAEIKPLLKVQLNAAQMAVLEDFVFNEGIGHLSSSTLLKDINASDFKDAPAELDKWVICQGIIHQGLVNRRKLEGKIWTGETKLDQS